MMNVSWSPPLQPNGIIEFYTVRLPEPRMEIRNTSILSVIFEDLVAYTEYTVTVTACTSKYTIITAFVIHPLEICPAFA